MKGEIDYIGPLQLPDDIEPEERSIITATYNYRQEAYIAKRDRMVQNRLNYDTYNLKGDFSHKKRGQSREFLPKQALAVEQISSFFQQAMIDTGDWFDVEREPGAKDSRLKPIEIKRKLQRELEHIKFDEKLVDSVKMGLLGSMCIAKIHGEYVDKPSFYTQQEMGDDNVIKTKLFRTDKKVWRSKIDLIRQEDWFPDPTGDNLFQIQQIEMDLHTVKQLSKGPNAIYDEHMVNAITGGFEDMEQVARKARETAQNQTFTSYRKRVRLWECWGTLINPHTGEVIAENVTWTVANDRWLISKPKPSPFWHGGSPFVAVPIIRTPKSVWHKALMDAPTMLNIALNETFNLALDNGLMAAHGIKQLRPEWLADETKIADGIAPGETLEVNNLCPPGMKVLEPVVTSQLNPEVMQIYDTTNQEFNAAAITNDLRMGAMPARAVKATEVVEASQSITSMFTGITKILEQNYIVEILKKMVPTIMQNANDWDEDESIAMFGKDRALEIAAMTPEERFKDVAQGMKFKVFGVSMILNKMKDYKKLMSLLQTIGGVQPLTEEFIKKYDFGKLLTEIMKSLDLDPEKLAVEAQEAAAMKSGAPGQSPAGPDQMSQIPQVMGSSNDMGSAGGPQPASSAMPGTQFPGNRATGMLK